MIYFRTWCPSVERKAKCIRFKINNSCLVIFFVYWYLVVDFIPCVSFAGEDPLHEGLWWHPLNWQHGPAALPVIAGSGKQRKKGRVHLG